MTEARQATECTFTTHEGVQLFYRHWPGTAPRRGCVVMFHRGHEHSGRIAHLADELNLPDFDIFAWDARGHGRSPGARGYSPNFGTSVRECKPSSTISTPPMASPTKTWRCWPRALVRC